NFGLGHLDPRIRVIGGVVFLDCNQNGIQDLQVEFDNRPRSGSYNIRLERTDGSNSLSPSSTRNNRYSFDNLDSGTYVVTLTGSDATRRATPGPRREVTTGNTFGAVVDFGVMDLRGNSDCAQAAAATAPQVQATAVVNANQTATAVVASGGNT